MVSKTTPIETALINFKARHIMLGQITALGVDLMPYFSQYRSLVRLFGRMVLGQLTEPEFWKPATIGKKFTPSMEQWELFFSMWLNEVQNDNLHGLRARGVDIINVEDPYSGLLEDLFLALYGQEAYDLVEGFIYDNKLHILYDAETGDVLNDLRKPGDFAVYFKLCYDSKYFNKASLN